MKMTRNYFTPPWGSELWTPPISPALRFLWGDFGKGRFGAEVCEAV